MLSIYWLDERNNSQKDKRNQIQNYVTTAIWKIEFLNVVKLHGTGKARRILFYNLTSSLKLPITFTIFMSVFLTYMGLLQRVDTRTHLLSKILSAIRINMTYQKAHVILINPNFKATILHRWHNCCVNKSCDEKLIWYQVVSFSW